ncbi:hypothetical protein MTO96_030535 [Rhipicephalus appendiculatus]
MPVYIDAAARDAMPEHKKALLLNALAIEGLNRYLRAIEDEPQPGANQTTPEDAQDAYKTTLKALDLAREEERVDRASQQVAGLAIDAVSSRAIQDGGSARRPRQEPGTWQPSSSGFPSRWRRLLSGCECVFRHRLCFHLLSGVAIGSRGCVLSLRFVAALGRLRRLPCQELYLFAVWETRALRKGLPINWGSVCCQCGSRQSMPTVSSCLSWYGYRWAWTAVLCSCAAKAWLTYACEDAIPDAPIEGPLPVTATAAPRELWVAFGALGCLSEATIAALPHFDTTCCGATHAKLVLAAAALAIVGTYGLDALVDKIYGPEPSMELAPYESFSTVRLSRRSYADVLGGYPARDFQVPGQILRRIRGLCCQLASLFRKSGANFQPVCRSVLPFVFLANALGSLAVKATGHLPSVSTCLSRYGSMIPEEPVNGPLPVEEVETPRWVLDVGARLGSFADFFIALLPKYNSVEYPITHAVVVLVAAALGVMGSFSIEAVAPKTVWAGISGILEPGKVVSKGVALGGSFCWWCPW